MAYKLKSALSLAIIWIIALQAMPVLAADDPDRATAIGLALYKQRRYKEAGDYFWKSIQLGSIKVENWLYRGHCFYATGQTFEAIQTYKVVMGTYLDSPEAAMAAGFIKKLDPQNNLQPPPKSVATAKILAPPPTGKTLPPPPGENTLPPPPGEATKSEDTLPPVKTFKDKVAVIAPRDGHPAVKKETVQTINKAIAKLPPRIQHLLDENNASVFVVPNLIDKFPEYKILKRDDGTTMGSDLGRTFGREIYVCQQTTDGETNASEACSPKDIEAAFFNQCGRVLDDILKISTMPEMKRAWEQDAENVPGDNRDSLKSYLKSDVGQTETCAELIAAILGGQGKNTQSMPTNFPRTYYLVKEKLKKEPKH
jgi:tetratricopeptide (TPR) repeat protein